MIEKLSEERLEKIEEIFRNPLPDSKIKAAQDYGVDLFLLLRWLKLSPQERIEEAQKRIFFSKKLKDKAKRKGITDERNQISG